MTTPYERALAIMMDREIPLAQLAGHLQVDRSAISRAFKNGKGLERHWPEIAVFLRLSADWLLYGKGAMDALPEPEPAPASTPAPASPSEPAFSGDVGVAILKELRLIRAKLDCKMPTPDDTDLREAVENVERSTHLRP